MTSRCDGLVVVGGAGFVGSRLVERAEQTGSSPVVVDRRRPTGWDRDVMVRDLLVDDLSGLPTGRVVLLAGDSNPRPRRPWTLALHNAVATARIAPHLAGSSVTLVSSAEVYGSAEGPLREDTRACLPLQARELAAWCDRVELAARAPCPPWTVEDLCRELVEADPTLRWVYALTKAAQEELVRRHVAQSRLTILRVANVFGVGQERVVARMVRAAMAGRAITVSRGVTRSFVPLDALVELLADPPEPGTWNVSAFTLGLDELADRVERIVGARTSRCRFDPPADDSCGVVDATRLAAARPELVDVDVDAALTSIVHQIEKRPALFDPPIATVVPPRPERPSVVARLQQEALWTGALKSGRRHTTALADRLSEHLGLDGGQQLVLTASGTAALLLAVVAAAGRATPGTRALLPSFTYPATAEVLTQLGYVPMFADVDPRTWTLDPADADRRIARDPRIRLVLAVDALGAPCDYQALRAVCRSRGIPLVADSAASLGSRTGQRPVGRQADAHAFSLSFAKVVSAGGAGGVAVLPEWARLDPAEHLLGVAPLSELHAIAAADQLAQLDELVQHRRATAAVYDELVARSPLQAQAVRDGDEHSYVHYVVRTETAADRRRLAERLHGLGVTTGAYYAPALHRSHWEPQWRAGGGSPLPVTDSLVPTVVALPMSSELDRDQAERVVMALEIALGLGRW